MKKIDNAKGLKEILNHTADEALVLGGVWNGYTNTYTVIDHVCECKFEEIENDFFGTPGKMDKRLFRGENMGKDVILLGSKFDHRISNPDIDFDDNPNVPIHLLNGENGNHDMFWEHNNFIKVHEHWHLEKDEWEIDYYPNDYKCIARNGEKYYFEGECIGIYDFYHIVDLCKIEHTWRI